eukprot:gene30531-37768_t
MSTNIIVEVRLSLLVKVWKLRYDVTSSDPNASFKCEGAKGFACLAYAVLRQPVVDTDAAPAMDVEYFLYNACISRAYSYIRLVILPVLQTSYVQDRDTSIFYVQVLCELLTSLSNVFCSPHYRDTYGDQEQLELERLGENDFPFVFFPPSQSFYNANLAFYVENKLNPKTASRAANTAVPSGNTAAGADKEALLAVDSLEDVLLLFNAMLDIRPHFATEFWSENSTASGLDSSFDMSFYKDSGAVAHPFVSKCVEASRVHPSLLLVTIQFAAHLAKGPLNSTAGNVYHLVKDARHPLLNWTHFYSVIDKIAQHLGAQLTGATTITSSGGAGAGALTTSGAGLFGTMRGGGATYAETIHAQQQLHLHQHSRHHRPLQLTLKDLDGVFGILELLGAVCSSGAVAQSVLEHYPLVSRLFSLLSCASLPATLKGAALRTLSVLAKLSSGYANLIWENIDFHKLLPFTGGQTIPAGRSLSPVNVGGPPPTGQSNGYNMNATMSFGATGGLLSAQNQSSQQQSSGPFAHIPPPVSSSGGAFNSTAPH